MKQNWLQQILTAFKRSLAKTLCLIVKKDKSKIFDLTDIGIERTLSIDYLIVMNSAIIVAI